MTHRHHPEKNENGGPRRRVLLALLPFWTPLIPPMGIAALKNYVEKYGHKVKTVDANIETQFKEVYDRYFDTLQEFIPANRRGNFYNIGHDVMQNHMMAYMNQKNKKEYTALVKILIYKIFYCSLDDSQVSRINAVVEEIFRRLQQYILQMLEKEKPDVFGLTVHIHTLPASLFAFKLAKERYPQIQTVMGGGIFTEQLSLGSENLDFFLKKIDYIDRIIVGEGEVLFLEFLEGKSDNSKRLYTIKDTGKDNLEFAHKGLPDLSDFRLEYYLSLAAAGSISCPFQCSFCSETVYFGKYRKKSPRQTVEEIITLHRRYGGQLFNMADSLLNPIITGLAEEFIKADVPIYWDGCLRVAPATGDIENTLHWRRGGFYGANLGIETGSQRILDLMGKKITVEQSKATLRALAYAGIKTTTYWVIGYPGETEADFQHTLDFVEELKDEIYQAESHPFQFLNGLVNYDHWVKNNRVIPLYPEEARDMMVIQTFIIDCSPSREEIYRRLNRFVHHCNRLGIPNVYSERELYLADKRWEKIHKNAVPAMIEFKEKNSHLNECRNIKKMYPSQKIQTDQGDFLF